MARYKVVKTVDFGPWTIGDKNYGPACPSCMVSINNYAPKVGSILEGTIETRSYYVFQNNKKVLKTGKGLVWRIATNGSASTQAQMSDQFITEDHLVADDVPVENPEPVVPSDPGPENPSTPTGLKDESCWICKNKIGLLLIVAAIVVLFILEQE